MRPKKRKTAPPVQAKQSLPAATRPVPTQPYRTPGRAAAVLGAEPKIVTLDIETTPLESYTWGTFEQNVGVDQIKTEWSVLSYAAKWLGTWKVEYADTSGRGPDKVRDDAEVLKALWHILDQADIVVAQNGASFDLKKINARLVMAGFAPYSPVRVIDTMLAARRAFKFTSNKLAWLSKHLTDAPKFEHRRFPGFELWAECMVDNPKAWAELRKYNIRDVVATEKLYLKLRPWIKGHPSMGAYSESTTPTCPKCGSTKLEKRGRAVLTASWYNRYCCQECGGWSRGKIMQLPLEKRRSLLVPE